MADPAFPAATRSKAIRVIEVGDNVGEAQRLLAQYFRGSDLVVDNRNGRATSALLARFQRAEGLRGRRGVNLGRVDELTLRQLRAAVADGGYLGLVARQTRQIIIDIDGPRHGGRVMEPALFAPRPPKPDDGALPTRSADVRRYTVRAGDKLQHIARAHGVSANDILRYNPGLDPRRLTENDLLLLPPTARREERPLAFDTQTERQARAWADAPPESEWRVLERGQANDRGPLVERLQHRLRQLGYLVGEVDGQFGESTQAAVRAFQGRNGERPDGVVSTNTWRLLVATNANPAGKVETGRIYAPGSPEQIALFTEAGIRAGLHPEEAARWARSADLQYILRRESGGQVGRVNYTYGHRARDPRLWASVHQELKRGRKTTRSSATGLGQLLLANVELYYPSGRLGIGDAMEEAIGMIRYIRAHHRYRDRHAVRGADGLTTRDNAVHRARAMYGVYHEGY